MHHRKYGRSAVHAYTAHLLTLEKGLSLCAKVPLVCASFQVKGVGQGQLEGIRLLDRIDIRVDIELHI